MLNPLIMLNTRSPRSSIRKPLDNRLEPVQPPRDAVRVDHRRVGRAGRLKVGPRPLGSLAVHGDRKHLQPIASCVIS